MQDLKFEIPRDYLLANSPFVYQGIGTMHSPTLRTIFDGTTDNLQTYYFAKALLDDNRENVIKILNSISENITSTEKLPLFEEIIKTENRRNFFAKVLSLFFINRIGFDDSVGAFLLLPTDETDNALQGYINNDTFDLYLSIIGQLLHDIKSLPEKQEDYSGKPPEVLKALEAFKKYENQEKSDNSKDYTLQNIISKMCISGCGYNLLNIYDLSIWQLLDQFQAYSQNRISRITERSFSIWGGEDFDFGLWLKNNN